MIELRIRNKISYGQMQQRVQRILTEKDYMARLTGPSFVLSPTGQPLCVYLPGAVKAEMAKAYPILTTIRGTTENRGYASGTGNKHTQNNVDRALPVMSSILGSFEASGFYKYCRLTSWMAQQMEDLWPELEPLWRGIAGHFQEHVPDRFNAQMARVARTAPDWVIPGTPFTTITVNNTFATGVHKDKGDLDEGFSCLAVARRGEYTGGTLTFPEYQIAVDMQDGDLILMDAHAWHGNTKLECGCDKGPLDVGPCEQCGAERISVVCYYRTKMEACGSADAEQERAVAWSERVYGVKSA